jgi:hypothetical protein
VTDYLFEGTLKISAGLPNQVVGQVQVDFRMVQSIVAQIGRQQGEFVLYVFPVRIPLVHFVNSQCMPEVVGSRALGAARLNGQIPHYSCKFDLYNGSFEGTAVSVQEKLLFRCGLAREVGLSSLPIGIQPADGPFSHRHPALFIEFRAVQKKSASVQIYVANSQAKGLANSHPARIQQVDDGLDTQPAKWKVLQSTRSRSVQDFPNFTQAEDVRSAWRFFHGQSAGQVEFYTPRHEKTLQYSQLAQPEIVSARRGVTFGQVSLQQVGSELFRSLSAHLEGQSVQSSQYERPVIQLHVAPGPMV